ncbi:unnamed protein product, partial [Acanthocheilonema viteae]
IATSNDKNGDDKSVGVSYAEINDDKLDWTADGFVKKFIH